MNLLGSHLSGFEDLPIDPLQAPTSVSSSPLDHFASGHNNSDESINVQSQWSRGTSRCSSSSSFCSSFRSSCSNGGDITISKKRRRDEGYKEALGERGIGTVGRVLSTSDEHLSSLLGSRLSTADVRWLKHDLARKTKAPGLRLSEIIDQYRIYDKCLSTGSVALDALLTGGMLTGELTELAGGSATGKTQVCLSTLATLLLDCDSARAVYLDTCNCFNAGRLYEIIMVRLEEEDEGKVEEGQEEQEEKCTEIAAAKMNEQRRSERAAQCLDRVHCVRAFDVVSLAAVLGEMAQFEAERAPVHGSGPLRLLVLDSITSIFASVVGGGARYSGSLCFSAMSHIAYLLHRLAKQLNLAVLITNSVVLDKSYGASSGTVDCKPALGRTWNKEPNMRLQLSATSDVDPTITACPSFCAKLTKSCRSALTCAPVYLSIGPAGVREKNL